MAELATQLTPEDESADLVHLPNHTTLRASVWPSQSEPSDLESVVERAILALVCE